MNGTSAIRTCLYSPRIVIETRISEAERQIYLQSSEISEYLPSDLNRPGRRKIPKMLEIGYHIMLFTQPLNPTNSSGLIN